MCGSGGYEAWGRILAHYRHERVFSANGNALSEM